jgi:hypothetical protein
MDQKSFIQGIELFYLVMLTLASFWAAYLVIQRWVANRNNSVSVRLGVFFALLIIISFGIPAVCRLIMTITPDLFPKTSVSATIFKIISLFNNLWLIMLADHLQQKEEIESSAVSRWQKIIVFSIIIMASIAIEPLVMSGIPFGKYALVLTDTVISFLAILSFTKSISKFLKPLTSYAVFHSLIWFLRIILPLLIVSSLCTFMLDAIYQQRPPTIILAGLLSLYLICVLIIYALLLAIVQTYGKAHPHASFVTDHKHEDLEIQVYGTQDDLLEMKNDKNPVQSELIPEQLMISFDNKLLQFSIELRCTDTERLAPVQFEWKGDKCPYPFFHWIYLSVAAINNLKVELKNAQVSRNKMCALLNPQLKPKNFITVWGITASLNLDPKKIILSDNLLDNNLVKMKFMDNLDSFLELTEHDADRLLRDRRYASEIAETTFNILKKSLQKRNNPSSAS